MTNGGSDCVRVHNGMAFLNSLFLNIFSFEYRLKVQSRCPIHNKRFGQFFGDFLACSMLSFGNRKQCKLSGIRLDTYHQVQKAPASVVPSVVTSKPETRRGSRCCSEM